ncbi:hypothetical protein GF336_05470 [Candidatus Woesearchaeota archaeon]|nr:hypothetical protein [Candidatus Woesearchaeota archaeon]
MYTLYSNQKEKAHLRSSLSLFKSSSPVIDQIIDIIDNSASCLLEDNYYDKDFLSCHQYFYSRSNSIIPHRCKRIHFFDKEIPNENLIYNKDFSRYQDNYMGYTIINPIENGKIGRTLVRGDSDNHEYYLTCKQKYTSSIAGTEFNINCAPFIPKDRNVMMCAHAALWMYLRFLHHFYQIGEFLPSEIATNVSSCLGQQEFPSQGATIGEIAEALKSFGLKVGLISEEKSNLYFKNKEDFIFNAAYPYLEAGLPVYATARKYFILENKKKHECVTKKHLECNPAIPYFQTGHAFLLIGHGKINRPSKESLQATFKSLQESKDQQHHPCVVEYSTFINQLIKHDDKDGMYCPVSYNIQEPDHKDKNYVLSEIDYMVIAQPENVSVNSVEALAYAKRVIKDIEPTITSKIISNKNNDTAYINRELKRFCSLTQNEALIIRIILTSSREYKKHINQLRCMTDSLRKYYLSLNMPKFIWVAEISRLQDFFSENVCGEILIDSTKGRHKNKNLALHVPGILFESDEDISFIKDDTSYPMMIRQSY